MSDILIRGVEMPTGCGAVTLQVWPDGQVEIIDADGEWKTSEAVPVPPHGRCIDENALLKGCGYIIADGMACIPVKYIANAPTIIPAQEGE